MVNSALGTVIIEVFSYFKSKHRPTYN